MTYDGLVYDLDEPLYHSLSGLSSTGAKKLLRSPAHYQHYLNGPRVEKAEFDLGHCVHSKVLGVGAAVAVYPDGTGPETFEFEGAELGNVLAANGAVSTKAAKAFGEHARANGRIPVKRATARVVDKIVESVLAHDEARALFEGGHPEVSMFATDPDTGVSLRGRLDYLGRRIADLKTTSGEATESAFARQVFNLGYEVQYGQYSFMHELITGESLPWLWVVVETEAPYITNVFALDRDERRMGFERAKKAREIYARCRDAGRWPARYENATGGAVGLVKAPQYAIYDYIDTMEGAAA